MKKDGNQFVKVSEIDGLHEYNEFARLIEETKELIKELQERAFQERKTGAEVDTEDGFEICAFKKDPSPMFIGMIQLAKQLISHNLDEAHNLVYRRRNNFFIYSNRGDFIPDINEERTR